jgi:hypothetical protein
LAPTDSLPQNILTASRATMDKAVRDRYLANWTRADFAAELGGYDAPTTLAVGASDPFVTADYLASTVSALRSGTLVTSNIAPEIFSAVAWVWAGVER